MTTRGKSLLAICCLLSVWFLNTSQGTAPRTPLTRKVDINDVGVAEQVDAGGVPEPTSRIKLVEHPQLKTLQIPGSPPGDALQPHEMNRLVILVMTGDNLISTRATAARSTWGLDAHQAGIPVVFVAESSRSEPFEVVGLGGDRGLPDFGNDDRMWKAWQYVLDSYPDAAFFFKCDCDTYVHVERLWKIVKMLSPSKLEMVGHCLWNVMATKLPYCNGGAGMLTTRHMLEVVVANRRLCVNTTHDDVTTAGCAVRMNGTLLDHAGFTFHPSPAAEPRNRAMSSAACARSTWITKHHQTAELQRRVFRFCHATGLPHLPSVANESLRN